PSSIQLKTLKPSLLCSGWVDYGVIILAGILGITIMRYMAGYFIRCLDEFIYLEDAAYSMIMLMGGYMVMDCFVPSWQLPEWATLIPVVGLLLWGFSKRRCSDVLP
ncbi:MAG: hypothetical protein WCD18_22795, partial [Thermosynechococcaceae cyanobacterium]